jgi:hypothetical protein
MLMMGLNTFQRAQTECKFVPWKPQEPKGHSQRPSFKTFSSAEKGGAKSPPITLRHDLKLSGGGRESGNVSSNDCQERTSMPTNPEDQYPHPLELSQSCSQGEHSAHM